MNLDIFSEIILPCYFFFARHLGGFRLKRLLCEDAERKRAVLEAEVEGSAHPAILVIEKLPFTYVGFSSRSCHSLHSSFGRVASILVGFYREFAIHARCNREAATFVVHRVATVHVGFSSRSFHSRWYFIEKLPFTLVFH